MELTDVALSHISAVDFKYLNNSTHRYKNIYYFKTSAFQNLCYLWKPMWWKSLYC